jgi:hypothetical protein
MRTPTWKRRHPERSGPRPSRGVNNRVRFERRIRRGGRTSENVSRGHCAEQRVASAGQRLRRLRQLQQPTGEHHRSAAIWRAAMRTRNDVKRQLRVRAARLQRVRRRLGGARYATEKFDRDDESRRLLCAATRHLAVPEPPLCGLGGVSAGAGTDKDDSRGHAATDDNRRPRRGRHRPHRCSRP